MIQLYKQKSVHYCFENCSKKIVSRWGILSFKNKNKNNFQITDVVEKQKLINENLIMQLLEIYFTKNYNEELKNLIGQSNKLITDAIRT